MNHSYVTISMKSSLIFGQMSKMKRRKKVRLTNKMDVNHKKCARIREIKQNATQVQVNEMMLRRYGFARTQNHPGSRFC